MKLRATIRRSLLLAALLGSTQAGIALGGDDAGVATSCLRRSDIRTTKILDDRNVLFITRDRATYNNQLVRQCPGMRRNSAMSFTYGDNGKLCAGSTFTVLFRAGMNSNLVPYWDPFTQKATTLQGPAFVTGPTCQIGMFSPVSEDEVSALIAATEKPKPSRRRSDRDAVKTEAVESAPSAERPSAQ
jgi:hypothetical protein